MKAELPKPTNVRRRAFTLIEAVVVMAISTTCMAAVMASFLFFARSTSAITNYTEMNQRSRNALDKMTRDIRQAAKLTNATPSSLSFTNFDGKLLRYTYDEDAQTLSYTNASTGEGGVLLHDCYPWSYSMFQYDPVPGTTMIFTNTTTASGCKVLVINWSCQKTNLSTLNSQVIQMAKIVMRN